MGFVLHGLFVSYDSYTSKSGDLRYNVLIACGSNCYRVSTSDIFDSSDLFGLSLGDEVYAQVVPRSTRNGLWIVCDSIRSGVKDDAVSA